MEWRRGARDPLGAWRFWRGLGGEQFEIVHLHFGGRSVRWLARAGTDAKIIVHLHGRILEPGGLNLVTHSGRGVDAVIAVSRAVAERVTNIRPVVVYTGVPVAESLIPSRESTTERVLGTAARLLAQKGIGYLLHSLASLRSEFPNLVLEIAGSGPERTTLERTTRALGLTDRVRFLGWVNDLAPLFGRWEAFVLPSLEEGLPVAPLEAMAAGLPVVATDVGGIPELVENGRTGWLVPPGDSQALAERLRQLLGDREKRLSMGAAGFARARRQFAVERMVKEIADIYDGLVGDRNESVASAGSCQG